MHHNEFHDASSCFLRVHSFRDPFHESRFFRRPDYRDPLITRTGQFPLITRTAGLGPENVSGSRESGNFQLDSATRDFRKVDVNPFRCSVYYSREDKQICRAVGDKQGSVGEIYAHVIT